jgi:signal transduction histidine kinase/ligand-binding sensor domain-containing protein
VIRTIYSAEIIAMIGPSHHPRYSQPIPGKHLCGLTGPGEPAARTAARMGAALLCLSLLGRLLPAQISPDAPRDIAPFQRVQPVEVQLHNSVMGIAQDHHGYIWLIGRSRLFRYDGNVFQCFSNTAADSLLHRWTYHGLAGGRHGVLCIYGPGDEVVFYDVDRSSADLYRLGQQRSGVSGSLHTTFVLEDARGRFAIATREGRVYRIDPRSREITLLNDGDSSRKGVGDIPLAALVEDANGNIWAGGEKGIVHVTGPTEKTHGEALSQLYAGVFSPDSVAAMLKGTSGEIWVATVGGEIGIFDSGNQSFTPSGRVNRPNLRTPIRCLSEDPSGNFWIATGSFGLDCFSPGKRTFQSYFSYGGRPGGLYASVLCLFVDRSGLLWIGTWAQGLITYAPWRRKFQSRTPAGGDLHTLSHTFVTSIREDREGTLWIGTMGDGLYSLPRGSTAFRHVHPVRGDPRSLSSYDVTCMCERKNGDLWFGTVDGGISILKPKAKAFLRMRHSSEDPWSLGSDTVNAIFEDHDGTVWVGNVRGVDRYEGRTGRFSSFIRWPAESVGRTGTAAYFYRDRRKNLWIATGGRGLLRLGPFAGDSVWYRHRPGDEGSLPTNGVDCLREDAQGRVWLGTPAGLSRFDDSSETFTTIHVLSYGRFQFRPGRSERFQAPSVGVVGITPDRSGNLWLSTTNGIARFNTANGASHLFGQADGVAAREGMRHALWTARDGGIYCGGNGGVCWFHPDSLGENTTPPPVVITEFRIAESDTALCVLDPGGIVLDFARNTFSITFAALDYADSRRNLYMYMLEGVDRTWVQAGTNRVVTYANVSPGSYLFRVRASNNDGVWNETGLSLPILIAPPLWQTWWFRGLVLVLLGALAYGAYRYRLAKVLALERLRLRIANDLHDDIGSDLSSLALESDLIARRIPEGDPGRERLRAVGRTIRSAADNLRDVVWIVSPDQDRVQDLEERMREGTAKMLQGLPYEFRSAGSMLSTPLDIEFKRHVLMIFKEMLHNVVSHAQASRVEVEFELNNGHMRLCVQDDGVGFEPSGKQSGRGLRSLRARASAIGGTVTIESTPGKGPAVCLEADITRL